jgi:DNA-binding MarR family transcriptional regulator
MAPRHAARKAARRAPPSPTAPGAARTAGRLHSLAIHLLRRLRREDGAAGLSAPRLSALSVVVFAGPVNLRELADAEQVRAPTMSRLVRTLEADGLVQRHAEPDDARAVRFTATSKGARLLAAGRDRRVATLAGAVSALSEADRETVGRSLDVLERVVEALARDAS